MGWEAIEQYLSEVEEQFRGVTHSFGDQQVPEPMLQDELDIMFSDRILEPLNTNCIPVELSAISATPVSVTEVTETKLVHTDIPEYFDLDHDNSSFYDECGNQNTCVNIKQEVGVDILQEQYSCHGNDFLDNQEQMYINMTSRIFHDLINDVQTTCSTLRISHDPTRWSADDVKRWIGWQCRQFNYPVPNLDYFHISGRRLCQLTETEFKILGRDSGSTLYSQLDIWKSVMEQTSGNYFPAHSPSQQQQFIQIPAAEMRCSSPPGSVSPHGSVSPSPSNTSEELGSPSVVSHLQSDDWSTDESMPLDQHATAFTDDIQDMPAATQPHARHSIQLWQFLKDLLLKPELYSDCIKWLDQSRGIFKIENSARVAKLWGRRKNRPAMNYDKLSRSIRQYYKKRIIMKTEQSKRLVYQFCPAYL